MRYVPKISRSDVFLVAVLIGFGNFFLASFVFKSNTSFPILEFIIFVGVPLLLAIPAWNYIRRSEARSEVLGIVSTTVEMWDAYERHRNALDNRRTHIDRLYYGDELRFSEELEKLERDVLRAFREEGERIKAAQVKLRRLFDAAKLDDYQVSEEGATSAAGDKPTVMAP